MKEIITVQISDYLTNELARKIALAQWHCDNPKWINQIRRATYEDKYFYYCFEVVATNQNDGVIGRLHCIQNEKFKNLWYYGDLFVAPEYRRMGIASQMVKAAIKRLTELEASTLRVYVEPDNKPSLELQKTLGFLEKPFETFNNLINDGQIMLELELPNLYSVITATADEAFFVRMFYMQNLDCLHGKFISLDEWKTVLSTEDKDEKNFLICKGCMPVAWLRINGLQNKDIAWISMLAVSDKHQHQGVGSFSIQFAENYTKKIGFSKMGIHTTDDNIPAQNLYKKHGYTITEYGECTTGDDEKRMGYTFEKTLS